MKYPYSFDPRKRRAAKIYTRTKIINGMLNGFLGPVAFLALFLYFGGSGLLLNTLPEGWIAVPLYAACFALILSAVQLPLRFYSSFIYEHKHKLSRQTLGAWAKDYAKSSAVSYAFSIAAITGVYYIMSYTVVRFIMDRWGIASLREVLKNLSGGQHLMNAIDDALLLSEKEFEARWVRKFDISEVVELFRKMF